MPETLSAGKTAQIAKMMKHTLKIDLIVAFQCLALSIIRIALSQLIVGVAYMQIFSTVKLGAWLRHSFIYLHNEKTLKGFPGTLVGPNALKSALSHVESAKPTSLGSESRPWPAAKKGTRLA